VLKESENVEAKLLLIGADTKYYVGVLRRKKKRQSCIILFDSFSYSEIKRNTAVLIEMISDRSLTLSLQSDRRALLRSCYYSGA
jgi:hypothetical protein